MDEIGHAGNHDALVKQVVNDIKMEFFVEWWSPSASFRTESNTAPDLRARSNQVEKPAKRRRK